MDFENTTAAERFVKRRDQYKKAGIPLAVHNGWWVIHNCIAHPMIGLLPSGATFWLHDYTSRKLMQGDQDGEVEESERDQ